MWQCRRHAFSIEHIAIWQFIQFWWEIIQKNKMNRKCVSSRIKNVHAESMCFGISHGKCNLFGREKKWTRRVSISRRKLTVSSFSLIQKPTIHQYLSALYSQFCPLFWPRLSTLFLYTFFFFSFIHCLLYYVWNFQAMLFSKVNDIYVLL